jgi:hypothetical protein
MNQAVVTYMFCAQQVSTAALLETIVESVELAVWMLLTEGVCELEGEGEQLFGYLEYYSE